MKHLVFSPGKLKVFNSLTHSLLFMCQCRNNAVNAGFGHWGSCPPGTYKLGAPQRLTPPEVPFGSWFIPLLDVHGLWKKDGRDGIGIHGGGSGLRDPFAPRQGWVITEGCFRAQNEDLDRLAALIQNGDEMTVEQSMGS